MQIVLEDVNDNAPFIYPTVAEVCDDAKNLSVVILGASDKDLHPNTDPFKFEIHKQGVPDKVWKVSKINSKSGETSYSCSLGFEAYNPSPLLLVPGLTGLISSESHPAGADSFPTSG